jgi:predicted transcriptional regulator
VSYARTSITLPESLLIAADQRARELDRPRSWVVAEALRAYLRRDAPTNGDESKPPVQVFEPTPPPYAASAVAEARLLHLEADLRLSPAERLRRAEELARLARRRQRRGTRSQIIAFDTYEDFCEWKKARRGGV